MGLMLSGAFIAIAVTVYGADRFRTEQINSDHSDIKIGPWYNYLVQYAIPIQVTILITWWFYQVLRTDPENWWNPFATESIGTCLFQWTVAILIFMTFNRFIVKRTLSE